MTSHLWFIHQQLDIVSQVVDLVLHLVCGHLILHDSAGPAYSWPLGRRDRLLLEVCDSEPEMLN